MKTPTSSNNARRFDKNLVEDVKDYHLPDNSWVHARNAINNSVTGDLGQLGNEPANRECITVPNGYTIIGFIHLRADEWAVYSTDDSGSEIGLFKEESCSYTTIVNDPCLNFNRKYLIRGVSRSTSDCTTQVYWDEINGGPNPSRTMEIENPPFIENCREVDGCKICEPTTQLDCNKLRLARLIETPCLTLKKGVGAGTLPNGTYFVTAAYSIDGIKVTDYFTPSNPIALFDHENVAGSLDILIEPINTDFDEMEVVVVSTINQQTVAWKLGIYSTRQGLISIDLINPQLTKVPIEFLPVMTPVIEKTDAMYSVNNYLIRVGTKSKFDFNYQPLANQIRTKWVNVEYPENYYKKGGNNASHMRDEVYPYFIRWVYDTGDKSPSFHIPGRPLFGGENTPEFNADVITQEESLSTPSIPRWKAVNTATITSLVTSTLPDGGRVVAEGYMGYWESTERYPDADPTRWNAGVSIPIYPGTQVSDYDLCGKRIRHHKFPDIVTSNGSTDTSHFRKVGTDNFIRLMGVKFENIRPPVDNNGNLIPGIVGYEILRGSRQGNRTIIAKGIVNNLGLYNPLDKTPAPGNDPNTYYYPNYPYNDLRVNQFLSKTKTTQPYQPALGGGSPLGNLADLIVNDDENYDPYVDQANLSIFSKNLHTFHSPDTTFDRPFLGTRELKVSAVISGQVRGKFEYSEKHPKAKLINLTGFVISVIVGVGLGVLALNGRRRVEFLGPTTEDPTGGFLASGNGFFGAIPTSGVGAAKLLELGLFNTALNAQFPIMMSLNSLSGLLNSLAGGNANSDPNYTAALTASSALVMGVAPSITSGGGFRISNEGGELDYMPSVFSAIGGIATFAYYTSQGVDKTLDLIRAYSKYKQYALKYNSHGLYDTIHPINNPYASYRKSISNVQYLDSHIQNVKNNIKVNNLFRSKCVYLEVDTLGVNTGSYPGLYYPHTVSSAPFDDTRQRVSDSIPMAVLEMNALGMVKDPTSSDFRTNTCVYYTSIKQQIDNQYGQLDSIVQLNASNCVLPKASGNNLSTSPVIFGGDVYVGRYTEKNTFFYFYDWMYDLPDGFEFDYEEYKMISYPRYWANTSKYEVSDFVNGVITAINNFVSGISFIPPTVPIGSLINDLKAALPTGMYNLDVGSATGLNISFTATMKGWFYLFHSGVRDFYVESEINVNHRDWGDNFGERHYDWWNYTNIKDLFHTEIIKKGNYYKYDPSLSVSKTILNYTSKSIIQPRSYDPLVAETCYVYQPNKVIYSLPSNRESKFDSWRYFLANNYRIFSSRVTAIKSVNRTGAMIFFNNESPVQFVGQEQLTTDAGTAITIGQGNLFDQISQNIMNTEKPIEYGSCQDALSVINTPVGLFWMSQNQGKIFRLGKGEITRDMKWWFSSFMEYELLKAFPNFNIKENPVAGIGCQSVYNNDDMLIYFCKKDYKPKNIPGIPITYNPNTKQFKAGLLTIELGDPEYFEDASWTVSYDPKSESWISYHDWHPDLTLSSKNTFMTTKVGGIWVHNDRCDLYCNYYENDYPFELEYQTQKGVQVDSLRSIEYYLEAYKYDNNCFDRFHILDENFDQAVVFNTEQCSGLLNLNNTPKNNAPLIVQYPIVNFNDIDILYSKEEQKYRFNQFWDITDDRGEFNLAAQRMIWNTQPNGYVKLLNPNNLNYTKDPTQRKKFRHYVQNVFLRKRISGNVKFLVSIALNKNLNSPR
jgi:hypothetical protein